MTEVGNFSSQWRRQHLSADDKFRNTADFSIITSDNPRKEDPEAIVADILEGFASKESFDVVLDRHDAIAEGLHKTGRKDILLIAGKGHETYQELKETIIPFDDRETVREILG